MLNRYKANDAHFSHPSSLRKEVENKTIANRVFGEETVNVRGSFISVALFVCCPLYGFWVQSNFLLAIPWNRRQQHIPLSCGRNVIHFSDSVLALGRKKKIGSSIWPRQDLQELNVFFKIPLGFLSELCIDKWKILSIASLTFSLANYFCKSYFTIHIWMHTWNRGFIVVLFADC